MTKYINKPVPPGIRNRKESAEWLCTSCGRQETSAERNQKEQHRYYAGQRRYTCLLCGGTMQLVVKEMT